MRNAAESPSYRRKVKWVGMNKMQPKPHTFESSEASSIPIALFNFQELSNL